MAGRLANLFATRWALLIPRVQARSRPPNRLLRLRLDGIQTRLQVTDDQLRDYYEPLADLVARLPRPASRLVIAVAGPPGSGKTVIANVLASVINMREGGDHAVVLGLDGWHRSNEYLASHFTVRGDSNVPLMRLKGSPETFDVTASLATLRRIRAGECLACPMYDRSRHDPVHDAITITERETVVIFEGNYVLLDQEPWNAFRNLLDLGIYVAADENVLVPALLERHRRGGKHAADAERAVREVDLENAALVAHSRPRADVVLVKANRERIAEMDVGCGLTDTSSVDRPPPGEGRS